MKTYTVLIVDVINSRQLDDRFTAQKQLIFIIELLNDVFSDHLINEIEISSGDSFQGVFKNTVTAFLYARMVQLLAQDIEFRIGIGIGELDYFDETFTSNMLDGEAFHRAKQAMEKIRDHKFQTHIYVKGSNDLSGLNTLLDLYYKFINQQSKKSKQISLLYECVYPISFDNKYHYLNHMSDEIRKNLLGVTELITNTNNARLRELNVFDVNEQLNNLNLDYRSTILRGSIETIANVLGQSRQNIQKYVSSDVAQERYYAIKICHFLMDK